MNYSGLNFLVKLFNHLWDIHNFQFASTNRKKKWTSLGCFDLGFCFDYGLFGYEIVEIYGCTLWTTYLPYFSPITFFRLADHAIFRLEAKRTEKHMSTCKFGSLLRRVKKRLHKNMHEGEYKVIFLKTFIWHSSEKLSFFILHIFHVTNSIIEFKFLELLFQ